MNADGLELDAEVELLPTVTVPQRYRVRPGARGRVVVTDPAWNMVSVVFGGQDRRPLLMHKRHVRWVGPPRAPVVTAVTDSL